MPGPIKRRSKRACDLCFAKRIKCDQREPECSNCKLYHRECRRSVNRSKESPPTVRSVAVRRPADDAGPAQEAALTPAVNITPPSSSDAITITPERHSPSTTSPPPAPSSTLWTFNFVAPTLYHGPSDSSSLWLPPLDDLIPLIDHYFHALNPSLPLFSQPALMRILSSFLSSPHDRVSWSAILVVVALSLQSDYPVHIPAQKRKSWVDYCMRNAQSVLAELTARDEDLLGLQVIVALTMLYRNSVDMRPASMLIGIAVRLVYQMQLHSRETAVYFSEEEVQLRADVFWVAYVMDMTISLKLKAPSTLSNVYIDIPKPTSSSGIIYTKDRTAHLNIFHERVKLAEIETQVYALLYSTTSSPLTHPQRQTTIAHVATLLETWYAAIPDPFKPENAPSQLDDAELVQLAGMYNVYLFSQICTRDVWSERAEWALRVSSLSRAAMREIMAALQGPKVTPCMQRQERPSMDAWGKCVVAGRGVMGLFHATSKTTSLTIQSICALSGAAVTILANVLLDTTLDPEIRAHDLELITKFRQVYGELFAGYNSVVYNSVCIIIDDLGKLVAESIAVRSAQSEYTALMGEKAPLSLDPALLGIDNALLGFDGQGQVGEFDFGDPLASGILVDNTVFDAQWVN